MATYKKRGFKNKASSNKAEALEQKSTTANVFNSLDEGSSKAQIWVEKNKNIIFSFVAIIAFSVIGFLFYSEYIINPKERDAFNNMYFSQNIFEEALLINNDSLYNLSLNGDDENIGMLNVIENFKGTNASNLANYYAGMIYLKMNDYKNAIKFLSDYKSDDLILGSLATGSIGDAFSELNQFEDAYEYYVKASKNINNYTSPMFLHKAGLIALKLNKYKLAEEHFTTIKFDFSKSPEAKNIDAFISKAIASNN